MVTHLNTNQPICSLYWPERTIGLAEYAHCYFGEEGESLLSKRVSRRLNNDQLKPPVTFPCEALGTDMGRHGYRYG